jgi:hypothetical protein
MECFEGRNPCIMKNKAVLETHGLWRPNPTISNSMFGLKVSKHASQRGDITVRVFICEKSKILNELFSIICVKGND